MGKRRDKSMGQSRWPSVVEWMNKLRYTQTMKYYSGLKRNDLPSHENTWRNFKCLLLNERRQFEKATYYIIPTVRHLGKDEIIETVKR